MRAIGNSGARSAGPMGWPVPGWRGGAGAMPAGSRSATMLYQALGIRSSSRTNLVRRDAALAIERILPGYALRSVRGRASLTPHAPLQQTWPATPLRPAIGSAAERRLDERLVARRAAAGVAPAQRRALT